MNPNQMLLLVHCMVKSIQQFMTTYHPIGSKYQRGKANLKLVSVTSTHFRAGLIFINFTVKKALFRRDNHQDYVERCWHSNTHSKTILNTLVIILNYVF